MPISLARAKQHIATETSRLSASKQRSKWPNFLYHACDITTAIEIIRHDRLKCRNNAENFLDVANEGALKIFDGAHSCARLYFRPKNGFHFRTEGIKCINDPYRLDNHMSIPVMLLFSFEKIITLPSAKFSKGNIQKSREFLDGDVEFNNLDFSAIYHDGPLSSSEKEYIANMRMSEVSVEGDIPLANTLQAVVFRTTSDLQTFNYFLQREGIVCNYRTLVERVKQSLFLSRGFFLNDLSFSNGELSLMFHFPVDFTPDNREFSIYAEQDCEGRNKIFDKKLKLTMPTLNITNFRKQSGLWRITLERQLAFNGFLKDAVSELI